MARLQDFPSVTPTSSDNLLVVQSDGQGLASVGSTLGAKMDKTNPTGTGALSLNRKANTTVGSYSTAEGLNCTASANYSHAEGQETVASGLRSHSEGRETVASGQYGHAEGYQSKSEGMSSHAEGEGSTSSGATSHSEGMGTIANHRSQHVFGEYNDADASTAAVTARGNFVEIVGKGADDVHRSNARTLDWSGNEVLAGGLKVNGSDDVVSTVYSYYNWANTHTFKVSKPATYLLFTDSGNDMAKLKVYSDNVATLYQMIGTNIQSVTLNTSTMEVTVTVNNKGLVAIRLM